MDFNLSVVARPPEALVTLRGELDLATAPEVRRQLRAAMKQGARRMLIDLSGITFVDASALGMFTATHRELSERGGTLKFVAYPPAFLRLCQATGLVEHFGLDGVDADDFQVPA
jgi:anti-sigma B factor antagonist